MPVFTAFASPPPITTRSAQRRRSPAAPSIIITRASAPAGIKAVVFMSFDPNTFSQLAMPGAKRTLHFIPSFAAKRLIRRPCDSTHSASLPCTALISAQGWFMRISRAFSYHMQPQPLSAAI